MLEIGGTPGIGCMAIRADVCTGNVVRRLARYNPVVMTADACTQDIGMIYYRGRLFPAGNLMAAFTDICRLNMLRVFATRIYTIVASKTHACHTIVVIVADIPGNRIMAIVAGSAIRGDMGR